MSSSNGSNSLVVKQRTLVHNVPAGQSVNLISMNSPDRRILFRCTQTHPQYSPQIDIAVQTICMYGNIGWMCVTMLLNEN